MRGSHPFSPPIEFGSRPYSGQTGLRECVQQPPQTRSVTVDHRASSWIAPLLLGLLILQSTISPLFRTIYHSVTGRTPRGWSTWPAPVLWHHSTAAYVIRIRANAWLPRWRHTGWSTDAVLPDAVRLGCSVCVPPGCLLTSWLGLQAGPKQNNPASHIEWCGCMRHTVGWNTCYKGTSGFDQTGRQKARRPNIDTMTRRQTFDLGRHRSEHTVSFLFVVFCSVCLRRSRPRCHS